MPYAYTDFSSTASGAEGMGLGNDWLRAVCHDNGDGLLVAG
ncbi:hypothetical protein [Streptomyces sp. NPDC086835]|jgi:hypothetical protein